MTISGVVVLTNCTNRKREPVQASLRARGLKRGTLASISQEWVSKLSKYPGRHRAVQLYCGRVVTETRQAAAALRAQIAFISAGLGVVLENQNVPSYSLTVASGHPDSVGSRVMGSYEPAAWWRALSRARGLERPLTKFIESHPKKLVLIAMPANYVAMVAADLADLSPKNLMRVRILGPRRREELPTILRCGWLPYDARLDNVATGINGTASDFPQRALRHFATEVLPHHASGCSVEHALAVERILSGYRPYVRPRGKNATDAQLLVVIRKLWATHRGIRAPILREIRRGMGLACEQSRFKRLANEYEERLSAAK